MSGSGLPPEMTPRGAQGELPAGRLPTLRPPSRRSHWRITLIGLGVLAALVLFRAATTGRFPEPTTRTPQGAAAGYLQGLKDGSAAKVATYLVTADDPKIAEMLGQLRRYHASITVPELVLLSQRGDSASLALAAQVCYALHSVRTSYQCVSIDKAPLSLPDTLYCVKVQGRWQVKTLLIARA